ncbi:Uncharacterized oxidoreductase YbbO [Gammaproteobacteria bacterium]
MFPPFPTSPSHSSVVPRTILITGCSSGIGLTTARGLQARGHRVFASARQPRDVEQLKTEGFERALRLDVDDSDSIREALDQVLTATQGRLYALFNNAGFGLAGAVEDLSRDALRAQFETNLFGLHELTCRVLPVMRRQGEGRIIQNASLLGFVALPYRGAYSASKFALEGLTDTLRLELHGTGIRVSIIEPGPIASRFRANAHAAWQRYVDSESSPHREAYLALAARLTKPDAAMPFTLPPEAVFQCVVHALENPRPRRRYRVTFPAHALAILKRLLPAAWLDPLLRRIGGSGKR